MKDGPQMTERKENVLLLVLLHYLAVASVAWKPHGYFPVAPASLRKYGK